MKRNQNMLRIYGAKFTCYAYVLSLCASHCISNDFIDMLFAIYMCGRRLILLPPRLGRHSVIIRLFPFSWSCLLDFPVNLVPKYNTNIKYTHLKYHSCEWKMVYFFKNDSKSIIVSYSSSWYSTVSSSMLKPCPVKFDCFSIE